MKPRFERARMIKQRGLVLFLALVALVALSLAAVALIRSVDTSTLIAGNLAFKQAATTSGDRGVEAAVSWLAAQQLATTAAAAGTTLNVLNNVNDPFNQTNATAGYYPTLDPTKSLTDGTGFGWDSSDSALAPPITGDNSGNITRYIIQRMCSPGTVLPRNPSPGNPGCLFSGPVMSTSSQGIQLPQEVCDPLVSPGCPVLGQNPQIRITTQVKGPRNTVSYVQAFVY